MRWGPGVDTDRGLTIQATVQKGVAVVICASQGRIAARSLRQPRQVLLVVLQLAVQRVASQRSIRRLGLRLQLREGARHDVIDEGRVGHCAQLTATVACGPNLERSKRPTDMVKPADRIRVPKRPSLSGS